MAKTKDYYRPALHAVMIGSLAGTCLSILLKAKKLHVATGLLLAASIAEHCRINRKLMFKPTPRQNKNMTGKVASGASSLVK